MRTALVLAAISLAGCTREDGERLARVGRLAGEKVRDCAPAKSPLGDLKPESTPAGRVRTRFQLDAALAGLPIQVVDGSDGVHLSGRVAKPEQAEWAVKLARETAGVGVVVNELVVSTP